MAVWTSTTLPIPGKMIGWKPKMSQTEWKTDKHRTPHSQNAMETTTKLSIWLLFVHAMPNKPWPTWPTAPAQPRPAPTPYGPGGKRTMKLKLMRKQHQSDGINLNTSARPTSKERVMRRMGAMSCNYCCDTVLRPSCTACFRSCVSPSNCSCHHLFKRLIMLSNEAPGEFGSFLPLFERNPLSILNFAFVCFPVQGAFL